MRIVVAMDSFKGSLTSLEAGNAVRDGIMKADPSACVTVCPMADGGEGTVEALRQGLGGDAVTVSVMGPLGASVDAVYCVLPDRRTAVMEMAAAAGITLVAPRERDVRRATTYGVGQLILDAIARGCRHFILGIGGSATNDGGTGMLAALGYEFLDQNGDKIPLGAAGLEQLHRISAENVLPELAECTFRIACDVTNPLCGSNGCSAIFGPQKGATQDMIPQLDAWLRNYGKLAKTVSEKADPDYPGAGAAGGLGFAFLTFTNATLEPGVEIILSETGLEEKIRSADIVVTGEGRLDRQTVMGKAPIGVAKLAKKHGKKVIAFCGCLGEGAEACLDHGIDAYFPIVQTSATAEEALRTENAYRDLRDTACGVFRRMFAEKS